MGMLIPFKEVFNRADARPLQHQDDRRFVNCTSYPAALPSVSRHTPIRPRTNSVTVKMSSVNHEISPKVYKNKNKKFCQFESN